MQKPPVGNFWSADDVTFKFVIFTTYEDHYRPNFDCVHALKYNTQDIGF